MTEIECTMQHCYLVIVFVRKQLLPLTERPLDPNSIDDPSIGFYPAYEVYTILKSREHAFGWEFGD